jgi:diguanylate cyclase (GGDEF)-like protein
MRNRIAALFPDQPDPALLYRVFFVQQICLALVAQVAAIAFAIRIFTPLAHLLPTAWTGMDACLALAALSCTLSFFLSESGRTRRMLLLSRLFAILTGMIPALVFLGPAFYISPGLKAFLNAGQAASQHGRSSLLPLIAFALLAVVALLVRATRRQVHHVTDVCTACLCLVVLILFSECIFGALRIFIPSVTAFTSPLTLACLVPLTVVAALRQAEHGAFSIYLGSGIGSRIARFVSPVLIALPLLRETARAHMINSQLLPANYATAILVSVATGISFVLVLFLAWRINSMETKIHDLTLRDELTGLYNLRGFNLLAEQALRLAHRSGVPFSVLFIDLDNLKVINDRFGHSFGSAAIVETAKLLNATFREVDVIGRIGGDEFVVAGQLGQEATAAAIQRLQDVFASQSSEAGRRFSLNFSIGCVTSAENAHESLKELVTKADKAMYQDKRRKKMRSN